MRPPPMPRTAHLGIFFASAFVLAVLPLAAAPPTNTPKAASDAAFFREKVHPLLETHCFKCHGNGKTKGGLNLTRRDAVLEGGESGPAIQTGDPDKSRLLAMLSYRDADHEMPPAGKLPPEDIALLAEWVARGVPFDPALEAAPAQAPARGEPLGQKPADWWAYKPLSHNPPPPSETASHPIDRFLNARLKAAGLPPAPPASRAQLIRRASYNLTGLPPTPEEVEAFTNDPAPDAWPRLIDRLLASPHYGEKWARHWMDVIRYAETEGFEYDQAKDHIWRYRDYLIDAFNDDVPYDRFVTEQLAGDELAPASEKTLAATGFLRVMQCDTSPADAVQARYDVLADIVQVSGEAFLGMSLGCARCHDHKKDPLTQKDYFSFMSFFHGLQDYAATRARPIIWLAPSENDRLEAERRKKLEALDTARLRLEALLLAATADLPPGRDQPELVAPAAGPENAWRFTTSEPPANWRAENGFDPKNWQSTGSPEPQTGRPVWMRALFGLAEVPKTLHLDFAYSGDTEIFLNGRPLFEGRALPGGRRTLELTPKTAPSLQTGLNVLAFKTSPATQGPVFPVLRLGPPPELRREAHLKKMEAGVLNALNKEAGGDLFTLLKNNRTAWFEECKRQLGIPINAVSERADPPPLHIHRRGNPNAKGEAVEPAFPAVLALGGAAQAPMVARVHARPGAPGGTGPAQAGVERPSSGRRTALARWMTDPSNPLLSRVAANRIWQHHFNRGIVPSSTDFGRLGELPSHPELLDWLAGEFIRSGWSHKAMHRLLMTSDAYQRSCAASETQLATDPDNLLLWRFPMRRLTSEEIRDSVLSVSGVLRRELHGPPVYPPLPREVLETQSVPGRGWPLQTREQAARRSIYVHIKRSLSVPILAEHDQAPTDTPCAMRFVSTVPTQALGMLNSAFMDEHAALFAERLTAAAGPALEPVLRLGLRLSLQREPAPEELAHLLQTHSSLCAQSGVDAPTALRRLALLLLNLNEFLYLD